jgi:malate synthase
MTINALNSGANVWLADFEDATSPTWHNLITGQANLLDAINGTLQFDVPGGKHYQIGPNPATIVVRPRGWHLVDKHVLVDSRPICGALMDFGLYLFHCAQRQLDRGRGPYFYLPKLESAAEARLWNDIFVYAEQLLGLPHGTIRATVLIETIHAAFQMAEILYELRDHCAGLNAGRWDYLFSVIKAFADRGAEFVLPDRSALTMDTPMMRAYAQLLVQTCHRRGAHAIGGMSAFIPSRDEAANARAVEQVRLDKTREAHDGFDGSWVAHPGLVQTCRTVFDEALGPAANQIGIHRESVRISAADLLNVSATPGTVTTPGVRANVRVALRYITTWLAGNGAVAIDGLMEDAATAEISRCQIWQWITNATPITDGTPGGIVDPQLVHRLLKEEASAAITDGAPSIHVADAQHVFEAVALGAELPPFLTSWAYCRYLVEAA